MKTCYLFSNQKLFLTGEPTPLSGHEVRKKGIQGDPKVAQQNNSRKMPAFRT